MLDPGSTEVRFERIPECWVALMQPKGIMVCGGQRVFPDEGLRFLRGLKVQYTGSMTRATDVKNSTAPPEPLGGGDAL